jgi:hypothetical protein
VHGWPVPVVLRVEDCAGGGALRTRRVRCVLAWSGVGASSVGVPSAASALRSSPRCRRRRGFGFGFAGSQTPTAETSRPKSVGRWTGMDHTDGEDYSQQFDQSFMTSCMAICEIELGKVGLKI